MTYRDDREALHHRVAKLEGELADARRQGEEHGRDEAQTRAAALEKKVGDMRAELEKMEAELSAMRGPRPRETSKRNAVLAVGVALVALTGAGVYVSTRTTPLPHVEIPASPPTPLAPAVQDQPPRAPEPTPAATVKAPKPVTPPRSTTARWTAKVARAEGLTIAPGSACAIDATITATDTNTSVPALTITCGAQKLYSSRDALNGMAQMSNDARERLGPGDDKSTFTLSYRDLGTRTGERTQVDLDTNAHQAAVFKETIPRFRVELSVPSTSTPGAPLGGSAERLRREGKITGTTGSAPVKSGAACVFRAMATGKGSECVAELTCGTTVLFPSNARVQCTYDGARPVTVTTEDGAATNLTFEEPTLTVKTRTFTATVALDDL